MNSDSIITVGAIGFIFLLFNVIFLAVIFSAQKDAAVATKWPTTIGTILMSTLKSRRTNSGRHAQYPVVLYSYQAGGRTLTKATVLPLVSKSAGLARQKDWQGMKQAPR